MFIKSIVNSIIQKAVYRYRADSESYVQYLKRIGADIGEDVLFYSPNTSYVDIQNPHLLKIGNSVHISSGVNIVTHDFSWAVLKKVYGEVLGAQGEVSIGNNCFIGVNSTVLRNTSIGDNVIIGANSVVHGSIPSNSVVCGNPARVIMSLEDFYMKRKGLQSEEAINVTRKYKERFGRNPDINVLSEYFWEFTNNPEDLTEKCIMQMKNCNNYDESMKAFVSHKPKYDGIQDLLDSI